jgi:hypothetical protein
MRLLAAAILATIVHPAFAAEVLPTTRPATTAAATRPALTEAQRQAKCTRLFDFLQKEYNLLLAKRKDRVARSLLVVSLSRVPSPQVTKQLFDLARTETDPLVRAVAWDALFSRAPILTLDDYKRWVDLTAALLDADLIRGDLRVAALDLLAAGPPDPRANAMFGAIFARTDSRRPEDDAVIEALGRCVAAWGSPDVVEGLIQRLTVLDDAWRADRVLHAAGCPLAPRDNRFDLGSREALKIAFDQHVAWWRSAKPKWREAKVDLASAPWRKLRPHLIPETPLPSAVDPDDKLWRRDLELRPPDLRAFDVAFVVDATGSMGPALAWLRADVGRLMSGIGLVCLEPRMGVTFYRDRGDEFVTRHTPLTSKVAVLRTALDTIAAKGGGDLPEAVLDGLHACANDNPWTTNAAARRAIVLVGDAPPHPQTQKDAEALVATAARAGTRLHVLRVAGPYAGDPAGLDALAMAAGATAMETTAAELTAARMRRVPWDLNRGFPGNGPATAPAGRRVLTALLVDAINPQFADRVEPVAAVLWELLHDGTPEKQEMFGPAVEVTDMGRRPPPKGVQDR